MGANIKPDELTAKQDLFALEYIIDFNATKAALRAKYSPKTAHVIGHENLKKPKIQKRIEHYKKQSLINADITIEQVLNELKILALSDATDIFKEKNEIITLEELYKLPPQVKRAIKSFEAGKDGIKIKFHSKEKSLEMLGRYLSMFSDKLQIDGDIKTDNELVIKVIQIDNGAGPPKRDKK